MPKFINNIVKEFFNIYVEEKDIRQSYGNKYADHFLYVDPITGKKKISAEKVFMRILIVFIATIVLFIFARMMTYNASFEWVN